MLKNRQEGILNLHGLWATAALLFLFMILERLFPLFGYGFATDNMDLYKIGVVIGSIVNLRLYRNFADQLLSLDWGKTFHLTYHQVLRIALVEFAIAFTLKDQGVGRVFLGIFLVLAFFLLYAMNKALPRRLCKLSFKTQVIRTALVGSTSAVNALQSWITRKSDYGLDIVGYIPEDPCPDADEQPVKCLGTVAEIDEALKKHEIAQVVVLQNSLSKATTERVMRASQKSGCRIRIYNNWQEQYQHRMVVEHEGEYTFLTFEDEPLENPINRSIKRALDVAIALPIVAFVLPVLTLFVWAVQKRQSPGPIFYAQPRTGMTKRTFHIIKYRTMHSSDDNARNVAKQATKGDSRIYPFGSFLRRSSLDELPQFINVLLGEMSIAGPRPHLIDHDKQFSEYLQAYSTRHFVKPGITGLAQSKGFRGEITEMDLLRQRIAYDISYINNWSLALDLKIILMTAKAVLFPPKSAY